MFSQTSLVATLVLALAVAASPVVNVRDTLVTLPIAKRVNITGAASLHDRDLARARQLRARAEAKIAGQTFVQDAAVVSVSATNQGVDYVVNVCTLSFSVLSNSNGFFRSVSVVPPPHVRSASVFIIYYLS